MRGLKLNENQSENPTEINGSKYYLQIFPCQPRIEYKSKKKIEVDQITCSTVLKLFFPVNTIKKIP